ncbi:MAG: hypothetical protein IKN12_05335 [Selenomonadaceae bacterium]|nr:hypothetical protein [Selenomonadaceae bacterium]
MELSDKNEVIAEFFERYAKIFKNESKESVGCFVEDGCLYSALIFFEEKWRLLELCKVELDSDADEEIVKAVDEVLFKNNFKERTVSLVVPEKFLLKSEFILEEKIPEHEVKDAAYWEFREKYFSSKNFSVAYYKLQDIIYLVFALEENEQKRINKVFEKQNITVSDWMILPKDFDFRLKGNFAEVAGASLEVPIDANIAELEEGAPAIFAAMVGAGLTQNFENLRFSPLYASDVYDWKRIALVVAALAVVLFGSIFAVDMARMYDAKREANFLRNEAQNLAVDKTRIRLFNEITDDVKLREKIIAEKTMERFSVYGVLSHLGTLTQDGVIVKSIKTREKIIEIECEALSRQAMEQFLENIDEKRDLFIFSPKSLKTSESSRIRFSFSVDLRG